MKTRSLRFRLIMWHAGLLSAAFVLFSVAVYEMLRHYPEHSLAEVMLRRTDQIAISLLADVESSESRGSRFRVELPISSQNQ